MGESSESRERALELMLEYLKDRYSDQVATFRDVDTKIKQRLTVCAAAVGLVTIGLPAVAKSCAPWPVLVLAVLVLVLFGLSLFRMLWLALRVLEVKVYLPGFSATAFEQAARYEKLELIPVLQELVVNYAQAVENNATLIAERNPAGDALRFWGKCTVVAAFIAVGFLGIVYVFSVSLATP